MFLKIGKKESLPVRRISIVQIPDQILPLLQRTSCTIHPSDTSDISLETSTGVCIGTLKPFVSHRSTFYELLRCSSSDVCCPILNDFDELTFEIAPDAPPFEDASTTESSPRRWSNEMTFRSLQMLRTRYEDSRRQLCGLLAELRAVFAHDKKEVSREIRTKAYDDIQSFRSEQDSLITLARNLETILRERGLEQKDSEEEKEETTSEKEE
jgi:hypothetical protein